MTATDAAAAVAAVDEAARADARAVLDRLRPDWPAVATAVAAATADVLHVTPRGRVPLDVGPLPRVVGAAEWDRLAAGLAQRVRALEAFLRDPSVAVRAGVVPASLVASSIHRAPAQPPPAVPVGVYGPDLARDADDRLVVIEDNLRTPTLMGYAGAVAAAVRAAVPPPVPLRDPAPVLLDGLRRVLRAAAPDRDDPVVAVLVDDRTANVTWEPDRLAGLLGLPAVQLGDLRARGDRLLLPDGRAVDVLWRRTSEERLTDDAGRLNRLGTALAGPLRAGTVRVVNPFGTGVADDKRTLAYVEDLVRLHLGEEPLLRAARAYDLGADLTAVRDRLDTLVLKPRAGCGGHGVTVMPQTAPAERDRVVRAVLADPAGWVAQEPVALSTSPWLVGAAWEPRHVDLRPCVLSDGATVTVVPGGLTRASRRAGDLVVNCSQGGGGLDTWVPAADGA